MPDQNHDQHFDTRAVHAGTRTPRPDFTPTVVPIHPSVTYLYDQMEDLDGVFAGTRQGYVYSRYGNPTVTALEEIVAVLEGGEAALAFASGMAAVHAALLAVGAKAYLVLFDPNTVRDTATFTDPYQYPEGIAYVYVNGEAAITPEGHTGALAGEVLKLSA